MEQLTSASRFMGSRGFSGGGGDAIGKVEILSSVESCGQKGRISAARASEQAFLFKMPETQQFVPNGGETSAAKELKRGNVSGSHPLIPGSDGRELHQQSGKAARGSSGSLKRSRMVQFALSVYEPGVEDIKSNLHGDGFSPTKCVAAENAQTSKQKNSSNVKRSDKRCGRPPKSKSDSFCLKSGLVSFSAVTGGSSFLAAYASKSDVFDVTKPVDELPLDELLDGSYKRPNLVKDKGKCVQDSNDNLINSVRKACTLLQLDKPVPVSRFLEVDSMYTQKVLVDPFSTGGGSASRMDGKADSPTINELSSDKDSFSDVKSPAFAINSPLVSPKDVLERLALPPSKELDSLLLDAMKPAASSRNTTELRAGKTVSHRNGLPPFTWSLNSSANSKSGNDTVKIPASRMVCPGRWVKMGHTLTPSEGSISLSVDLKSLTYDPSLVPVLSHSAPHDENVFSKYLKIPSFELSSASDSVPHAPTEEHSPRLLAAAELLCEMSLKHSNQSSRETMKALKKKSQKSTESRKLKSTQKYELLEVAPKSSRDPEHLFKVPDPEHLFKVPDGIFSSKKVKLTVEEKRDTVSRPNNPSPARKDPTNWFPPRSIKSSTQESVLDMKHYNNNVVKKSITMPPPSRVTDKAYNSKQKLKHIGSVNGNPAARNLDR